ncbi:MAG: moeB, partial [bacterium]
MEFTETQIERYSRHIILPDVGGKGQMKLAGASVLIIGAGGLGSPAAFYLAAAGVGTIGLVDGDVVDLSNLQRQILHTTADIGKPKVDSGRETLAALNPDVAIKTYQMNIAAENILDIIGDYDF